MDYKTAKIKLQQNVSDISYFNKKTFNIIMADRKKAYELAAQNEDVQAFYRSSDTAKTNFYNKNGSAYCQLLSLLD